MIGREIEILALLAAHHEERRGRKTRLAEDALGEDLVHADGAGSDTRAGVRDTGKLQETLDAAVLPTLSVETEEYYIRMDGDYLGDIVAGKVEELRVDIALALKGFIYCLAAAERDFSFG